MRKSVSIGLVGSLVVIATAGAQEYEVRELPGLSTFFTGTFARDLAEDGTAVGDSLNNSLGRRAVVWAPDGTVTDIGTGSSTTMSQAHGISPSRAFIVGEDRNASNVTEAAIWDDLLTRNFLGSIETNSGGSAGAVNDASLAVGASLNAVRIFRAVKYENGAVVELNTMYESRAGDVNSAGQIVGSMDTTEGVKAVLWEGTTETPLQTLGGRRDAAAAINENGFIVGSALHPVDSKIHAVNWQNGMIQDMGLYQNFFPTAARDVNDNGVIVGTATIEFVSDRTTALIWRNGVAEELNNLIPFDSGWDLLVPAAINNAGQIVGWGERDGNLNATRAFILTPLPCPADRTGDGFVDVFDLLDYLNSWFALLPDADLDGVPGIDVFDLLAYLDSWFLGCD